MLASGIDVVGAAGYVIANTLARANLQLGHIVVVDCVNPVTASRNGWRNIACGATAGLVEIEIVCSDLDEHRRRVEARSVDIPGLVLPTWADVRTRTFEPWTGDHLVLDTATMTVTEAVHHAKTYVRERSSGDK
jgi:predicted kinase